MKMKRDRDEEREREKNIDSEVNNEKCKSATAVISCGPIFQRVQCFFCDLSDGAVHTLRDWIEPHQAVAFSHARTVGFAETMTEGHEDTRTQTKNTQRHNDTIRGTTENNEREKQKLEARENQTATFATSATPAASAIAPT